jgi:hypothetical protein
MVTIYTNYNERNSIQRDREKFSGRFGAEQQLYILSHPTLCRTCASHEGTRVVLLPRIVILQ